MVTCETCERPAAELRDGICSTCFAEGAAIIQREADEYQVWVVEQILT
jgi:NMD protein affecting ribosome stability and mRNA decay